MYTLDILKEGIVYLGINDPKDISTIIRSNIENIQYMNECKNIKVYEDPFVIPRGKTKIEYKEILNDTQKKLDSLKIRINERPIEERLFLQFEQEDYIIKKKKLKALLANHKQFGELSIAKAREYPIDQLLDFNTSGFTTCIFHSEKSPSAKLDRKRNKLHCFGCHYDADPIDIYRKLYNVTLPEAIKQLT